MREIRIRPRTQVLAVFGAIAGIAAAIATQLPELRRYLKVKAM